MAAPELFIPTDAAFEAELTARTALKTGAVYWKIEVDDDFDDSYTDFTSYIDGNQVSVGGSGSIFKAATSGGASFVLRNVPKAWSEGDLAGAPVKISVKIGDSSYIQIFSGYVEGRGAQRQKSGLTGDVITVSVLDPSESKAVARTAQAQTLYAGLKICDTSTTSNSIAHKLAEKLGLTIPDDVDFVALNYTKDYVYIDKQASYWRELQDLALQYSAILGFRYDGVLRLITWSEAEWNSPTSEYTFDSSNVHSFVGVGTDVMCNRCRTEFETYHLLATGIIFKSYDQYNETTKENEIEVAAGKYWPSADDQYAVARLNYERDGEKFGLGVSIETPTIGATGSGSDIEYTGGTLTLESFNGTEGTNPGNTARQAGSSELILKNTGASTCTITRLTLRGVPIRVTSKITVQHTEAGVDEWDIVEQELPGKYAVSQAQAEIPCQRLVEFGKEPRARYEVICDFAPQVQAGGVVTFNPTDDINMLAVVEQYEHQSSGPHTRTRTKLTLVEHTSFTSSAGGSTTTTEANGGTAEGVQDIRDDVDDRPTYEEVINDGWTKGTGTQTPTVPSIVAHGLYKATALEWDRQANLTNFARYEVQVSDDAGTTWYSLDFDGDGIGTVTEDTDWTIERLVHSRIPFGGTEDAPTGTTYHYRVRRVTRAAVASDWSDAASATTLTIDTGDIAENSITTNKLVTGLLNTMVAEVLSYLEVSDTLGWLAGTYTTPVSGDQRAYLDKNEFRLQIHNGAGWLDRFVVAASDETDDYVVSAIPAITTTLKVQGYLNGGSGVGLEFRYGSSADIGDVMAYDRDTSTYKYVRLLGAGIIGSILGNTRFYLEENTLALGSFTSNRNTDWHANYFALNCSGSAIIFQDNTTDGDAIIMVGNAWLDTTATWKARNNADAIGFQFDGSAQRFYWFHAPAPGADNTAITFVNHMVLYCNDTTYTMLALGGAADDTTNRDAYLKVATDAYLLWDESESTFVFNITGTHQAYIGVDVVGFGGKAGGSNRAFTMYFATDATLAWDESGDKFTFNKALTATNLTVTTWITGGTNSTLTIGLVDAQRILSYSLVTASNWTENTFYDAFTSALANSAFIAAHGWMIRSGVFYIVFAVSRVDSNTLRIHYHAADSPSGGSTVDCDDADATVVGSSCAIYA